MAQQARIPKFGNWVAGENAPYTQYFDDARKLKSGGKLINPNDPQEYQPSISSDAFPNQAPPPRSSSEPDQRKTNYPQQACKEGHDLHVPTRSPVRHEALARKTGQDSTLQHEDKPSDPHKRPGRSNAGSEHDVDHSPIHSHSHAKSTESSTKGVHSAAPNTPTRIRMRIPDRSDELEKGSAVPKFGAWDESDPSSADGYTDIFNKVREEKHRSAAKVPMITTEPDYETMYGGTQARRSQSSGCSCFQWFKK